jgi:quercetin dioxygenase-like cupin family protein
MSALPPKADMCGATRDVRFGPIADTGGRQCYSRADLILTLKEAKKKRNVAKSSLRQLLKGSDVGAASAKPNYSVKNIEPVVVGTDVQARVFTLAPDEFIPWHRHSESMDHYFVLSGTLSITTRDPNDEHMLETGGRYKITAGTSHLIANRAKSDCVFLLVQGVGKYDFIKSAD